MRAQMEEVIPLGPSFCTTFFSHPIEFLAGPESHPSPNTASTITITTLLFNMCRKTNKGPRASVSPIRVQLHKLYLARMKASTGGKVSQHDQKKSDNDRKDTRPAKGLLGPNAPERTIVLLCRKTEGDFETRKQVTKLAFNLLMIVEEKCLMPEYSALCRMGACILAAQFALNAVVLRSHALGHLAGPVKVAYAVLKARTTRNEQVVLAVLDAEGDPYRFLSEISGDRKGAAMPVKSLGTMLHERIAARGGSRLRMSVKADEISEAERASEAGPSTLLCGKFYAVLEEEMMDYESGPEHT